MSTFILAFLLLSFVVIAMSVGVLCGRSPIKGSCGGLSALGMKQGCEICGGDDKKCEKEQRRVAKMQASLAYDASQGNQK